MKRCYIAIMWWEPFPEHFVGFVRKHMLGMGNRSNVRQMVKWGVSKSIEGLHKLLEKAKGSPLSAAIYFVKKMANDGNQAVPMMTANASTSRTPALAPAEKPGKFSGMDFKRWQQKMFFYLTTLCLQKFIKEDVPDLPDETPENDSFLVIEAWKHSDFLCRNYILSGLEDNLYNVYSGVETSKELWKALEKKYKTEDAGMKKFVAAKFLDYKMVDSKSVITQVQELQVIIHDLLAEEEQQRHDHEDDD
ncbi:uncharacterized protein LOC107784487 isoform X3 [Nicotiana tabacum]|uniref:Uncharacterized protein LOC107784487 isoform X3 n=1 Tax=Nicotiana tabacum TaxID=4097 RepID=A0AC58S9G6_TOBAC